MFHSLVIIDLCSGQAHSRHRKQVEQRGGEKPAHQHQGLEDGTPQENRQGKK